MFWLYGPRIFLERQPIDSDLLIVLESSPELFQVKLAGILRHDVS
jgi:hypothetical protein